MHLPQCACTLGVVRVFPTSSSHLQYTRGIEGLVEQVAGDLDQEKSLGRRLDYRQGWKFEAEDVIFREKMVSVSYQVSKSSSHNINTFTLTSCTRREDRRDEGGEAYPVLSATSSSRLTDRLTFNVSAV